MQQELYNKRHSLSHILAQALQRYVDPTVQLGTGPAIDDGFYYDVKFADGVEFGEENLKELEKQMKKIVKEGQEFGHIETDFDGAQKIAKLIGQNFKAELLEKFKQKGETKFTFYYNTIPAAAKDNHLKDAKKEYIKMYTMLTQHFLGQKPDLENKFIVFFDLCEGGHVENTKEIADDSFSLSKIAGAYRQGDEKNPMMTRIYGYAFETKEEHKNHLAMLEEAKKRDHRILGQKLEIFAFDDEVGPGLPLWLPNGTIIVEEIEKLAKEKEHEYGYTRVRSPHITKEQLYIRSGHLPYYQDDMFPPMEMDGEKYYLKPMNCPHHHKIFAATPKSYRDMPARYAEYGHCYRYEDSGALFGLMRVRSLCMNDAHIYCTEEQFEEEFMKVIELYLFYFKLFGIEKYQMRLSKHSKEGLGKKYVDNEPLWIKTEEQVRKVLIKSKVPFFEAEDEAAFYGPKIDVQINSAIGREFSLATNQLDFAIPAKFNLKYIDTDGQEKTPLCIHRAPLSTHERFVGFLLEHFAGAFPLWLAPKQIMLIPVADKFLPEVQAIHAQLHTQGLRVLTDDSSDSFSKKIRNAELDKIPYIVIIGEKEIENKTLSVREFRSKKQYEVGVEEFISLRKKEYDERTL